MVTEQSPRHKGCHAVLFDDVHKPIPCPRRAQPGHPYCSKHTGPLVRPKKLSPSEFLQEWAETAGHVIEKRVGGTKTEKGEHDPELVRALLPLALPLYSVYWRVDVFGIENIPTEGPAMLVANHSGTIPIDGAMLKMAVLKEHGRNPWLLAGDIAFKIPGFGSFIKTAGNAPADRKTTLKLMDDGELLGVFPEGYKGIGKGWKNRYKLQRFGRGGFIEMCMESGAPVIPVGIIGAEEAYPMIGNLKFLARRFGAPYFPITPTFPLLGPLGAIPLPSKWIIAIGEPIPMIEYGPKAADDTQLVLELTDHVRHTVQELINENLAKRRHTFI